MPAHELKKSVRRPTRSTAKEAPTAQSKFQMARILVVRSESLMRRTNQEKDVPSDEQLDSGVGDTDGLEDIIEVVRDKTVSRPLREEGDGDDNPHTLPVSRSRDKSLPADGLLNFTVELNGSPNFLVLVLDQGIFGVTIGVIVGEGLQSLLMATLADEPTGRFRAEPEEGNLDNGGETLESRGDTP